jgi:hypothetical protein
MPLSSWSHSSFFPLSAEIDPNVEAVSRNEGAETTLANSEAENGIEEVDPAGSKRGRDDTYTDNTVDDDAKKARIESAESDSEPPTALPKDDSSAANADSDMHQAAPNKEAAHTGFSTSESAIDAEVPTTVVPAAAADSDDTPQSDGVAVADGDAPVAATVCLEGSSEDRAAEPAAIAASTEDAPASTEAAADSEAAPADSEAALADSEAAPADSEAGTAPADGTDAAASEPPPPYVEPAAPPPAYPYQVQNTAPTAWLCEPPNPPPPPTPRPSRRPSRQLPRR